MLRTRLIAGSAAGLVLAAVFATLAMALNVGDALLPVTRVDPWRPAPLTLRLPTITSNEVDSQGRSHLRSRHVMVPRGEVVRDARTAAYVRAYEDTRRPPRAGALVGLWLVYFLLGTLLTSYLRTFTPTRGALLRTQAGLLGLSALAMLATKLIYLFTSFPSSLIPFCSLPLWAALYFDRRTSFLVTLTLAFLTASLANFSLVGVTVFLAQGMGATFGFRDRKHSSSMLVAGLVAGAVGAAVLIAARMLFDGEFDVAADLGRVASSEVLGAAVGGALGGLVAFALQPLAVTILGAVSRRTLLDLTDLENPLLQKMAREAPGSWEHARAMANLAEAASAAIHADALLTRVGAYYHDLGKTIQPKYFVENLEHGEESPHVALEPDVSADAIMAHVVEGVRILREGGIPEPVVEFCYTHHGTSVIEYFWHKCLERGNPKNLPESFFRYPGMRPRNKETAILMLVDSIEAASRTIDPPERAKFEEMVQRVIFVKTKQGQLDESGLTVEDLRILATRLTDTLVSAYHHRIRYPWQDRKDRGQSDLPTAGVATEEDVKKEHAALAEAAEAQAEADEAKARDAEPAAADGKSEP